MLFLLTRRVKTEVQQNAWPEAEGKAKRANSIELAPCRLATKSKSLDIESENPKMPQSLVPLERALKLCGERKAALRIAVT